MIKENILISIMWNRQRMYNGAFLKSLSILPVVITRPIRAHSDQLDNGSHYIRHKRQPLVVYRFSTWLLFYHKQ